MVKLLLMTLRIYYLFQCEWGTLSPSLVDRAMSLSIMTSLVDRAMSLSIMASPYGGMGIYYLFQREWCMPSLNDGWPARYLIFNIIDGSGVPIYANKIIVDSSRVIIFNTIYINHYHSLNHYNRPSYRRMGY